MLLKGNKNLILPLIKKELEHDNVSLVVSSSSKYRVLVSKEGQIRIVAPSNIDCDRLMELVKKSKSSILDYLENNVSEAFEGTDPVGLSREEIMDLAGKAEEYLTPLVKMYADRIGCKVNSICYKMQKTRWGSCSSRRNINLNILIMLLPEELRHTIVIHEVCHLRHMDHQHDFYNLCSSIQPNFKENQSRVQKLGDDIFRKAFGF